MGGRMGDGNKREGGSFFLAGKGGLSAFYKERTWKENLESRDSRETLKALLRSLWEVF